MPEIPQWLSEFAVRIHNLVADPAGMERFRVMLRAWAMEHRQAEREYDTSKRYRKHAFKQVMRVPRLRDHKVGPPKARWQWQCEKTLLGPQVVRGWVPPKAAFRPAAPVLPLPVAHRSLTLAAGYAALAAIHDTALKGIELIDPWQAEAGAEGVDPLKRLTEGWRYSSDLCDLVQHIPRTDLVNLNVQLDRVREDLVRVVHALQEQATGGKRKKKRKRRGGDRITKPLTPRQVEVVQIVGECKGNFAEVGRRLGRDRKTIQEAYEAAMDKMRQVGVKCPERKSRTKTTRFPEDHRGQVSIAEEPKRGV